MRAYRLVQRAFRRARALAASPSRAGAERRAGAELERLSTILDPAGATLARAVSCARAGELGDGSTVAAAIESRREELARCLVPLAAYGGTGRLDRLKTVAEVCAKSKTPREDALLYLLARELGAHRAIELGTSVGISSAYIAAGLRDAGSGQLATLECSPARTEIARRLHSELGLANVRYLGGLFAETLGGALSEYGPFDFAFIDGNHQTGPTLEHFAEFAGTSAAAPFSSWTTSAGRAAWRGHGIRSGRMRGWWRRSTAGHSACA